MAISSWYALQMRKGSSFLWAGRHITALPMQRAYVLCFWEPNSLNDFVAHPIHPYGSLPPDGQLVLEVSLKPSVSVLTQESFMGTSALPHAVPKAPVPSWLPDHLSPPTPSILSPQCSFVP